MQDNETPLSNRKHRCLQYKLTQRQWGRNPGRCIKNTLGLNITTSNVPPKARMVHYWTTKMTSTTRSTPGFNTSSKIYHQLWLEIDLEDIKNCYPSKHLAMGPDSIHTEELKKLKSAITAIILNLLMLCGRPPDFILGSRTILIPKKTTNERPRGLSYHFYLFSPHQESA